jgi:hypothetical protein
MTIQQIKVAEVTHCRMTNDSSAVREAKKRYIFGSIRSAKPSYFLQQQICTPGVHLASSAKGIKSNSSRFPKTGIQN